MMNEHEPRRASPSHLTESEIADFCRRLAQSSAIDADNLMMFAEDILANEGGQNRAMMLLDGMRAGIQQAREAQASGRVVAIWFDDNASRVIFSWNGDECPNDTMRRAVESAVSSAFRVNGE